jgi:hypothetical protein
MECKDCKSVIDQACEDALLFGSSMIEFTPSGCRCIPVQEVTKPFLIAPDEESASALKEQAPDITVIIQNRLPRI